jgi:hypothetical protein
MAENESVPTISLAAETPSVTLEEPKGMSRTMLK